MKPGLPPPEKVDLDLGYVRLTDSAPLIVARERGLFQRYDLNVTLHQEVSWANVRDKLAVGALDAAQMLAPLPAMTTLGVSGIRVPMLSGLTLSLNGNSIVLGGALQEQVRARQASDGLPAAQALERVLASRDGVPTFAAVHTFSTHMFLLREWLQSGGVDPDRDVRIIIVPPAQMVDSLANGVIDGYCVGEPWGSVAVHHGIGAIAALGKDIWPHAPEKVLCVTGKWHEHHTGSHMRLRLALMEACTWLADPDNRTEAALIIGKPEYLNLPSEWLLPSLTGRMRLEPGAEPVQQTDVHVFGSGMAGFPWRSQAEVLIARCGELLGRTLSRDQVTALAQQTSRPDLFRASARYLGVDTPASDRLSAHEPRRPGPERTESVPKSGPCTSTHHDPHDG